MAKVDCVVEALKEKFDEGIFRGSHDNSIEIAKRLLEKGSISDDEISEVTELPISEIMKLKDGIQNQSV